MQFEFATATRIIFGEGKSKAAGTLAKDMGSKALVFSGLHDNLTESLLCRLNNEGISAKVFPVEKEPDIAMAQEGAVRAREFKCDLVIGFGGGSAIDCGKAVTALVTNPGDVLEYLEVIGQGKPLKNPPLPYIAIPTTAGPGAEVTRNAVLASPDHQVKVSLRSPLMLPRLAIIDPELTIPLPPAITASTGLDALTQCIEPFISHLSNPLTDGICKEGMQRAARSLRKAFEQGDDIEARTDMSLASLFGGLALANAKLGAVHGFAGPLGGMYPSAPHGVICGLLLPFVMAANVQALQSRQTENPSLARFDQVAKILTENQSATAADGIVWINKLCEALTVPKLSNYGVEEAHFPTIIEKAQLASSMKGNPITLTHEELREILVKAI